MSFWIGCGFFVLCFVLIYNSLIGKKNQVENSYGTVDVMLKKRYDLIPNLVTTVSRYMTHERETLEHISALRSHAVSATTTPTDSAKIDSEMTGLLQGLSIQFEKYPNLKADTSFMQLQGALIEIEEQLSAARRAYNASVTGYNNGLEMFPMNIVAGFMGFTHKPMLQIESTERATPSVEEAFRKSS